jgi:hypothetical protein
MEFNELQTLIKSYNVSDGFEYGRMAVLADHPMISPTTKLNLSHPSIVRTL